MIVDPFDVNKALDKDGAVMGSVRWMKIEPGVAAPTVAELSAAPIIGYARPLCWTCGTNDCEHAKETK